MRVVLLLALAAAACAGPEYMDYEIVQYGQHLADPSAFQCCKASALNMCSGVADTACDDAGTCYCCPNGGGIDANVTGGVITSCTCGNQQTCTDPLCKGVSCGQHGHCSDGACKCDYAWSGPTCATSYECCTSPYNATGPTLCQSSNPQVVGKCLNDTMCYCCPYTPGQPTNRITLDISGKCKCQFHVTKCADPGPPPCDNVHCGLHATCTPSQGTCKCDKGWTDLNPKTNSCLTEVCYPNCGIHGTCINATCHCDNGFSGQTCKNFQGGKAPAPDWRVYSPGTPKSEIILYSAVIIPALVLFVVSLAHLTNKSWDATQRTTAGRAAAANARSLAMPSTAGDGNNNKDDTVGLLAPASYQELDAKE